ncbi:MAG TPA: pseudomurein-binding repeat-containing protein, partial [Methanobacteriaceae archaeon]|nr:pseudomurein-binding repeat-containing protein [Methanobacteriaceae archaeon]
MQKIRFCLLLLLGLVIFIAINGVSAANLTVDQVTNASGTVKSHVETNHALPSSVNISGNQVNMAQFLEISTTTVLNISNSSEGSVDLRNVVAASSPSETMTSGIINSTEYLDIANRIIPFMKSNGQAPNYASTSLGKMRYESLVYMFALILNSYDKRQELPDFIVVDPWSAVSSSTATFYNLDQVNDAASRVKSYLEINHALPNYVTMSGKQVNMASFLKITTTTLLNLEGNFDAPTIFKSCTSAPTPTETIPGKNMDYKEYINISCRIQTFMNIYGQAPNYASTSFGNMRYESLVYMYTKILTYYNTTGYLPANVTVHPWSVVSNPNTVFFTQDQIKNAAGAVKSYVETNHVLPASVTIAGKQVSMPQFLQLSSESLLNIKGTLCTSFIYTNYGSASNPAENATTTDINYTEYMDIANQINSFINSNKIAPNYATQSTGRTIRYESLVYIYAQILNSYSTTNGTLPDYITINPWSVVSNSNTVFLSYDQINNASGSVKSYVETNHMLPGSVNVNGKLVNMPQFLQISTTELLNIDSNLYTSIIVGNLDKFYMSQEDITSGEIEYEEYMDMARYSKSYIDFNGTVPYYAYQTSLGTHMGFTSLVYMYSQILDSYGLNNKILPNYITITPWVAISNPNAIYNYQSNKVFSTLQAAIDDNDTFYGDTIGLGRETILENIVIKKELTITPIPGLNVTVQSANPNLPLFTITTNGSGSFICGLTICGSTNSSGIYLDNSYYNA